MSFFEDIEREMRRIRRLFRDIESRIEESLREVTRPYIRAVEEAVEYAKPFADIREEDDKIIVTVDMAGIRKKNIDLTVTETDLEVRGTFEKEDAEIRRFKGYYLKTKLPAEVKPKEAKAKYQNGVLQVTLPKAVPVPKGIRIEIE